MDWTEKYRPSSLAEVVGNGPAVNRIRAWAESWASGNPGVRALVLAGNPGTGKTSTALALARDMGWSVIELNASDARNAGTIRRVATAGARHQTFAADGSYTAPTSNAASKLIILDEADNLYERLGDGGKDAAGSDFSDKGGKLQIIETIRQTRQPILLIVNDLYALEKGSGSALKALCETVKFQRVQARQVTPALERICRAEGITADREALELIAARADGDLRAAVRDLESIAIGRTRIARADLGSMGGRDATVTLFDLMGHILKGRKLDELRREVMDTDASPEDLVMWVDENVPKEYKDPRDLAAAYEMLAKADRFLGRTRSTQDYSLWSYAGQLSTLGVMAVRQTESRAGSGYTPFGFPGWIMRMGRTKGLRGTKDRVAEALGRELHGSKRKMRSDQVEAFTVLFATDREFAIEQTYRLELEDDEVALLLGSKSTVGELKAIRQAVEERLAADEAAARLRPAARPTGPLAQLASTHGTRPDDDEPDLPAGVDDDEPDLSAGADDDDQEAPPPPSAPPGKPAAGRAAPDASKAKPDAAGDKPAKPQPAAGQKSLF